MKKFRTSISVASGCYTAINTALRTPAQQPVRFLGPQQPDPDRAPEPACSPPASHIHYCRLILVFEDALEFAQPIPEGEWRTNADQASLTAMLNESAQVLAVTVRGRVRSGQPMNRHYDHPLLMLQHMIWHEGYHHGQIKRTLKLAGRSLDHESEAGPATWNAWMRKSQR